MEPLDWPTVKVVVLNFILSSGSIKEYQGTTLNHFSEDVLESCKEQALFDVCQLERRMRKRLEWLDAKLL